jgi:nucleoside 2-deoxyribosyltransferase
MKMLEQINNRDVVRAFKAPEKTSVPKGFKSIFLAGSIEMDKAEKWQDAITKTLLKDFDKVVVFNPRRDAWDSSWKQEVKNKNFFTQVDWEHQHIVDADFIFIYFQKDTQSPISLLELGLVSALGKKTVVCCPDGFWRKGNVDYICQKYDIELIDGINKLPEWLKKNGVE